MHSSHLGWATQLPPGTCVYANTLQSTMHPFKDAQTRASVTQTRASVTQESVCIGKKKI